MKKKATLVIKVLVLGSASLKNIADKAEEEWNGLDNDGPVTHLMIN